MNRLIANRIIAGEELHFILVEENFSDNSEPFTLFIHANHYNTRRELRNSFFFNTFTDAFEYCQTKYGIALDDWQEPPRFKHHFEFEYRVSDLGVPQPYLAGLEGGKVIFRMSDREIFGGRESRTEPVLNISGDRVGLQRLAAMLLLCSDGEQWDDYLHIHLEDEAGFHLPDLAVTLRNPTYFEALLENKFREATTGTIIIEDEE